MHFREYFLIVMMLFFVGEVLDVYVFGVVSILKITKHRNLPSGMTVL